MQHPWLAVGTDKVNPAACGTPDRQISKWRLLILRVFTRNPREEEAALEPQHHARPRGSDLGLVKVTERKYAVVTGNGSKLVTNWTQNGPKIDQNTR